MRCLLVRGLRALDGIAGAAIVCSGGGFPSIGRATLASVDRAFVRGSRILRPQTSTEGAGLQPAAP